MTERRGRVHTAGIREPPGERSATLIPWEVRREHRWSYAAMMLRAEESRRAGADLGADMSARLDRWLAERSAEGTVVDYDPGSEFGFAYVPRRCGIDHDVIRVPDPEEGSGLTGHTAPRTD